MLDKNRVIEIALGEVGYLEKETRRDLDDSTANPGDRNYTKYARDLDRILFYNGMKNGYSWCDVFVDWCFVKAYGKHLARAVTFQPSLAILNKGAGCRYSRGYYAEYDRLFDSPEPGDQIFFFGEDGKSVVHTGLVWKVEEGKVFTVEGNTSSDPGVVENGGSVNKKQYPFDDKRIAGYGRPLYEICIA